MILSKIVPQVRKVLWFFLKFWDISGLRNTPEILEAEYAVCPLVLSLNRGIDKELWKSYTAGLWFQDQVLAIWERPLVSDVYTCSTVCSGHQINDGSVPEWLWVARTWHYVSATLAPEEAGKGISQILATIFAKSSFGPFKRTGSLVFDFSQQLQICTLTIKKTRGQNNIWEKRWCFLKMWIFLNFGDHYFSL